MVYRYMRLWGILFILVALLSGCAGTTPTPDVLPLPNSPTPLPLQPPAAQPVATQVLPTNTAPPTVPAQAGDGDLTITPDGTETVTAVVPTLNPLDQPFLMRIDRVSVIVGRGTLLEGRIAHGTLQDGGSIEILRPQNTVLDTSILGIFISNTQVAQVTVGDYAGILVPSQEVSQVSPGMLLAETGAYDNYEEALQVIQ